ncbi:MAG: recombinase family protein [Dehalococcoidales bacterium]|jgi:site-specific DNA recombinase
METAVIYCRVSTDNQEREGTSLQTQLENCLTYCQSKGYDVSYRFSEAYSGLSLERPELDKLRELVRNEQIDVIVCYSLDRLSRDPGHGVIITQELEKCGVKLETVTEDVDNSELGKLISYIRGYASKVEAEKIRERTMRGRRAKARAGSITCGGSAKLYGYNYNKATPEIGGRRCINEDEAKWVRKMYEWLVYEHMSTNTITYRLRNLLVPTRYNKTWGRSTVLNVLKNPAYTGKTYAFTSLDGKQFKKSKEEWIEIPGATPPIVSCELFNAAQIQLQQNAETSSRNIKRQYVLRGHVFCKRCGRKFFGVCTYHGHGQERIIARRYRCTGKLRNVQPINLCNNPSRKADNLERLVWSELEKVLNNPEIIITEFEKQKDDAGHMDILENELKQLENELKTAEREQHRLLQLALKGFPENQVEAENNRLKKTKETLLAQEAELQAQFKASQDAIIRGSKLEHIIELLSQQIKASDFSTKLDFLDSMGIKVWIDGENIEITGSIPAEDGHTVIMQS